MTIEIPEGPVRFSREEMAELLEMRAQSGQDRMTKQLLEKGAAVLRAEGENLEQARAGLLVYRRRFWAAHYSLMLGGVSGVVYGGIQQSVLLILASWGLMVCPILADIAVLLLQTFLKKQRSKPQHEPEVRKK